MAKLKLVPQVGLNALTILYLDSKAVATLTVQDLEALRTQVEVAIESHRDSVRLHRFPGFEFLESISDSTNIWVVSLKTGKQYRAVRTRIGYNILLNLHKGNFRGAWPVVSTCAHDKLVETLNHLDSE